MAEMTPAAVAAQAAGDGGASPELWLQAISVTVALLVAGFTAYQFFHDRSQRRQDERKAQASKVIAWVSTHGFPATSANPFGDGSAGRMAEAVVLNGSELPVYRVVIVPVPMDGDVDTSGPQALRERDVPPGFYDVVAPGHSRVPLYMFDNTLHEDLAVEMAFSDTAGRHWVRGIDGSLTETAMQPIEYYGLDKPVAWSHTEPMDSPLNPG